MIYLDSPTRTPHITCIHIMLFQTLTNITPLAKWINPILIRSTIQSKTCISCEDRLRTLSGCMGKPTDLNVNFSHRDQWGIPTGKSSYCMHLHCRQYQIQFIDLLSSHSRNWEATVQLPLHTCGRKFARPQLDGFAVYHTHAVYLWKSTWVYNTGQVAIAYTL